MANSKKYGERCIAGIVVDYTYGKLGLKKGDDNRAQWIRPVTSDTHGQVPAKLVKDVVVGDLLEIMALGAQPDGFQSENVLFTPRSLSKLITIRFTGKTLEQLVDTDEFPFHSKEARLAEEAVTSLHHSLCCVRVEHFYPHIREFGFKPVLRAAFDYHGVHYDLPITDVPYNTAFRESPDSFPKQDSGWLCISLGLAHEGWHYLLVAGVIPVG